MTTPTELARQHRLAALRERSIVRTDVDVPSSAAAARARPRLLIRSRLAKRLRKVGIGAAMPETDPAPRQTDPAPRQINEPEPK